MRPGADAVSTMVLEEPFGMDLFFSLDVFEVAEIFSRDKYELGYAFNDLDEIVDTLGLEGGSNPRMLEGGEIQRQATPPPSLPLSPPPPLPRRRLRTLLHRRGHHPCRRCRCYFRLVHVPKSEILYEVPTGTIKVVVGLRWFDSAGEIVGGIPLKQPEEDEEDGDLVYSVIQGRFVPEEEYNEETQMHYI